MWFSLLLDTSRPVKANGLWRSKCTVLHHVSSISSRALQVCTPAVHKSPHITLHHLSLVPSKRKLNGITQPQCQPRSRCSCMSSVTPRNRSPTRYFPVVSFSVWHPGPFHRGQTEWPRGGRPGDLKSQWGDEWRPPLRSSTVDTTYVLSSSSGKCCGSHEWSKTQRGGPEPPVSPDCRLDDGKQSQQVGTRQRRGWKELCLKNKMEARKGARGKTGKGKDGEGKWEAAGNQEHKNAPNGTF